jgi:two-component system KDP operon response regulator KdpE
MSTKKILIVDDDEHLLMGLGAKLKANGFDVISVMDAISAISVAQRESPDIVLLDLGLPAGGGFLTLERMKSLSDLASTPVIVLSAWDPTVNKQRSLDGGAVAYFQKPPDNYELLAAIRSACGETPGLSKFLKT